MDVGFPVAFDNRIVLRLVWTGGLRLNGLEPDLVFETRHYP